MATTGFPANAGGVSRISRPLKAFIHKAAWVQFLFFNCRLFATTKAKETLQRMLRRLPFIVSSHKRSVVMGVGECGDYDKLAPDEPATLSPCRQAGRNRRRPETPDAC